MKKPGTSVKVDGVEVEGQKKKKEIAVSYETAHGKVILTRKLIKNYICKQANDQEIAMFLMTCKYLKLNPFLREIYLVKYSFDDPASIVIGKEALLKRAKRNPKYQGHKVDVIYDDKGNIKGAWAEVYVKGYQVPIRVEVDFDEYAGKKKDGSLNRFWATKPKTMIKKVALCQALREAFPDELGGVYAPEEVGLSEEQLDKEIIDISEEEKKEAEEQIKEEEGEEKETESKKENNDEEDDEKIKEGLFDNLSE